MGEELDKKLDKVLETIAFKGLVSAYELKKELDISLSQAQRLLSTLENDGDVMIYNPQTFPIQKKPYGLTSIGLLYSLSQPRVRRNFSKVIKTMLTYSKDDEIIRKDFQNALQDPKALQKIKELFISFSNALYELYDMDSFSNEKLFLLAKDLAVINEPVKMFSIFKYLIPRMSSIRSYAEAYCRGAKILCKSLEME